MQDLQTCRICKRLQRNFIKLEQAYPKYFNRPIKPLGSINSRICIVGLAPGLHGANRTGKPFFGDFSGNILFNALKKNRLSINNVKNGYKSVYITNSVKCYPPNNQPNLDEIKNCLTHLTQEFFLLKRLKVIIALGHIAHNSILRAYSLKMSNYKFSHGKIHKINERKLLIDSYHCSKININSKKLTNKMISDILNTAKEISYRNE